MTHPRQFALQAAAALCVLSLAWPYYYLRDSAWDWRTLALAIGATALLFAQLARQPWWWRVIHALFAPLLWLALQLDLPPALPLFLFLLLFVCFRGAAGGQIPLYLSNPATATRLATLMPANGRLIDVGAGIGSLITPLARLRPDLCLTGIENAPLPWLIGKCRTLRQRPRIAWLWGDFWRHSLAPYDVLYCFLSPAPMPALWQKACAEMRPGALLVSKAFAVPGCTPTEVLESAAGDPTDTLYLYRIPAARR
ncbi:MAG: class I SAM-dependent methyltransferase [Azovibrio sp.]|nr:class I SAM-dependent methyltransferase [Azovibrio sp.]